jgi:hypothetical protein
VESTAGKSHTGSVLRLERCRNGTLVAVQLRPVALRL